LKDQTTIYAASVAFYTALSITFESEYASWQVINFTSSFLVYAIVGGLLTAFLFVGGKELIGFCLGKCTLGSAYGAPGSVIVLLVWVYYSELITFIGAHVSALLLIKEKKL
jgi:uncharacterized BrkB/YihY/UPF0761 family membrane protein